MVSAKLGENLKDMEITMRGDIREVVTESMWLVKNVGEQLEKVTGVSARTHIVNMCKLIVEDKMSLSETMQLAEKTMAGEEDPPAEMAEDKITQLQNKLLEYLRHDHELSNQVLKEQKSSVVNISYIAGWDNALCWVLHLTGKMIDLNEFTL